MASEFPQPALSPLPRPDVMAAIGRRIHEVEVAPTAHVIDSLSDLPGLGRRIAEYMRK
ncbi:MAG: hypothetical protein JWL89_508 [Candidatus Saccharibacteria bacterium]|nr:hypothetical protein [Candidatus Saccharibacteria bacterium]